MYVAHNLLFANGGSCFTGISPYSGQVSILTGPDFNVVEPLITGLPVSNHDHGINGMVFDDNGDLLICVGGNSNAGVEDCDIGGLPESPLSAAILKAEVTKTNFNGQIVYVETASGNVNMDQAYGGIVDVTSGVDVAVFASGMRNVFDLVLTTANRIYAADNGPNTGFGPGSLSATTQGAEADDDDTLDFIEEGNYYGHPNRNRGRYDNRQNVYYDSTGPSIPGVFSQGLGTFDPSVNGIDEYRATTFNFAMYGELLLQEWNDALHRIKLSPDGRTITSTTTLFPSLVGLDVVHGPGGAIVCVDYSGESVTAATPLDISAIGCTAYDIFPWRAPISGGHSFIIGGVGLGSLTNTSVSIGGKTAVLTSVSSNRIHGVIPPGSLASGELLDVSVTVGGVTDVIPKAFLYLAEAAPPTDGKARLLVDPGGNMTSSSSYSSDSYMLDNLSPTQQIVRLVLDLSSALFPDLVFDPFGLAGDPVGKDLTLDTDPGVGYTGHNFLGPHDGGYDILEILFNDFDAGETLGFSIDIDPTSIQGAAQPGPGGSGSVSGLEHAGMQVVVELDDGGILQSRLYPVPGNDLASEVMLKSDLASAPGIDVLGIGQGPAVTTNVSQVLRVSGPAGSTVVVAVVEAAFYLQGVPGGGFDIDPFEANTALSVVHHGGTISPSGYIDTPITLTDSDPDGGLNHVIAAIRDDDGHTGLTAPIVVLELDAPAPAPPSLLGDPEDDPDGDGLSTTIEEWLGTNPYKADSDGDGADDYEEVYAGTDPTNENDFLALMIGHDPGLVRHAISWTTASGRLYTLYMTEDLADPWTAVHQVHGDDTVKIYVLPEQPLAQCYFRLVVER